MYLSTLFLKINYKYLGYVNYLYFICTAIKGIQIMQNALNSIERGFLNLPQVADVLATKEIKKLTSEFVNAQKAKFTKSVKLAKLVLQGYQWFQSAEGKELMETEGLSWTAEEFFQKVYNFKKSYAYRLIKVGKLTDEQIEAYVAECERLEAEGEPQGRDLKDLLKFVKTGSLESEGEGGGEGEGEGGGEGEGEAVEKPNGPWITIAVKGRNGESGYSIRVNQDGTLQGDGTRLPELVAILTGLVGGDGLDAVVFVDEDEDED